MDAPLTATETARVQWGVFVQRFLPELQAAGFGEEQLTVTWDTVATYIGGAWLLRGAIDNEDADTLRVMVEASDLANKEQLLATWDAMSATKKGSFWRFAKWFFNVVHT
jgi:hypothetical protein